MSCMRLSLRSCSDPADDLERSIGPGPPRPPKHHVSPTPSGKCAESTRTFGEPFGIHRDDLASGLEAH